MLIDAISNPISLKLSSLLIVMVVSCCLGLAFFLWHASPGAKQAKNCMALLTVITAVLAIAFVVKSELPLWHDRSYYWVSLQMALGPLLLFYARVQTQTCRYIRGTDLIHILPVFLSVLLWFWQMPLTAEHLMAFGCYMGDGCDVFQANRLVHKVFAWASLLLYSYWTLTLIKPYEKSIKNRFSDIEQISLKWLKVICWCFIGCTLLVIVFEFARVFGWNGTLSGAHVQAVAPAIMVLMIARYGIRQVTLSPESPEQNSVDQQVTSPSIAAKKYQTSCLKEDDARALWQRLSALMEEEQPHLEPGLKINDLAKQLSVAVNHLSETINGHADLSFYDFVNGYRIDEAIQLLRSSDVSHLSVTDIGFQAGFNSTSTFYAQFKSRVGCTPKQFRKQQSDTK